MTVTRKRWFKVGTALGTVPDGVPSEKTEKILNFLKMSFFLFLTYFSSKIYYFGTLLRGSKFGVLAGVSQWNGLKITSIG